MYNKKSNTLKYNAFHLLVSWITCSTYQDLLYLQNLFFIRLSRKYAEKFYYFLKKSAIFKEILKQKITGFCMYNKESNTQKYNYSSVGSPAALIKFCYIFFFKVKQKICYFLKKIFIRNLLFLKKF